jgi:hypothetical protein
MVKGFNLANYLMVALIMLLRHASKNLGSRAVAKNKRFEKVWLNLNNPTTNVIIMIVVMDEDQNSYSLCQNQITTNTAFYPKNQPATLCSQI